MIAGPERVGVSCQDPEHGISGRSGAYDPRYCEGRSVGVPGPVCRACYNRRYARLKRKLAMHCASLRDRDCRERPERRKGPPAAGKGPLPKVSRLPAGPLPRPTNQSTRPEPEPYRERAGPSFDALPAALVCRRILELWGTPEAAVVLTAERPGKGWDPGDDE